MIIKPVTDLRNHFPDVEKDIREKGEVFLTKNGYAAAVLLSIDEYTALKGNDTLPPNTDVLIDSTILLRYILDDDEDMALTAEHIIDGGAWTTPSVLADAVYAMEKACGFTRDDISAALNKIYIKVDTRPRNIVLRAIEEYESTNLGFVDCLMIAYALEGGQRFFTFDATVKRRLSELRHPDKDVVESLAGIIPADITLQEAREERLAAKEHKSSE